MLTTSENNYKRSLFSFQQSCINQIMTQSIGIHLKRKIRVIKKKKEKKFCSAQVRKMSLIVHSGFKTIKKSLGLHALQGLNAQDICVVVRCVQIILGRRSPCISLFSFFSVRRWSKTGANVQDDSIIQLKWLSLTQKGCGRCRRR